MPTGAEEAVRDLVRAAALLADRKRARQRITAMLLRHGRAWRGTSWTAAHEQWIAAQRSGEPALASALAHYRAALDTRRAELQAVADAVARPGCYRGIAELNGLALAAEVAGWRRFPSARAFMVPAGYSSGERTRRGPVTEAGPAAARTALIEAAWSYRFRPAIGVTLRRRQHDADPQTLARSWRAQRRLHARCKGMTARGKPAAVAVTATARELAGFAWGEMTS